MWAPTGVSPSFLGANDGKSAPLQSFAQRRGFPPGRMSLRNQDCFWKEPCEQQDSHPLPRLKHGLPSHGEAPFLPPAPSTHRGSHPPCQQMDYALRAWVQPLCWVTAWLTQPGGWPGGRAGRKQPDTPAQCHSPSSWKTPPCTSLKDRKTAPSCCRLVEWGGMEPGVMPPMSAWCPRLAT